MLDELELLLTEGLQLPDALRKVFHRMVSCIINVSAVAM